MEPHLRLRFCIALVACAACGKDFELSVDGGGMPGDAPPGPVRRADTVIDAPGSGPTVSFGDPTRAVDGVFGNGLENGSLDVYSLRFPPAADTYITLGWNHARLANGPGADLAVFENPFDTDVGPFMDLIIVEVSRDGVEWRPIAHDYTAPDETAYVRDRALWVGFAGKTPVLYNDDINVVDPFDAVAAGGDDLDLDNIVGDDAEAIAMRSDGVTQVRLVTAVARTNPDTGAPFVADDYSNGADIDGMFGRYVEDL